MRTIGTILTLLFCSVASFAGGDCLDEVKQTFAKVDSIRVPDMRYIYRYVMTIKLETRDKKMGGMHSNKIELVMGNGLYTMKTSQVEIYSDSVESYTVLPFKKVIYRDNSILKSMPDSLLNPMRSKVFSMVSSVQCAEQVIAGVNYTKTVCQMSRQASQQYQIASIRYLMDTKLGKVSSAKITHTVDSPLIATEILYHHSGQETRPMQYANGVKPLLFSATGVLLPAFKGYQVIDLRKRTKDIK